MLRFRFLILLACTTAMLPGCGTTPRLTEFSEKAGSASISTKTNATGLWLPLGRAEAFLSQGQERALHAVQDYEKQVMRGQPVDYHYEVSETTRGYLVTVHYGLGHEKNEPILPGASMLYQVDKMGRVQKRSVQ